ncbi:MAG: hypothetical protein IBX55_01380 [Methyloprofundus sp.]|nr:hypothetical protein [Methyloprofundus sp.]
MNYASLSMPLEPNEIYKFRNSVLRDMKRMINRGFKKQWVIQYFKEPLSSLLDMGAVNISQVSREIGVTRRTTYLAFYRSLDKKKSLTSGFLSAIKRSLEVKKKVSISDLDRGSGVRDNVDHKEKIPVFPGKEKECPLVPLSREGPGDLNEGEKPAAKEDEMEEYAGMSEEFIRLAKLSEKMSLAKNPLSDVKK